MDQVDQDELRRRRREATRRWRARNPERARETERAWCEANRDRKRESSRKYYRANKTLVRQSRAAWYLANREQERARTRIWINANLEKHREVSRVWHRVHREQSCATSRAWHQVNRARSRKNRLAWLAANPDKARAAAHKRRSRLAGTEGRYTSEDLSTIRASQRGRCACGKRLRRGSVDHMMPLSRGGSNWPENIALLCGPCNSQKRHRTMSEWFAWRRAAGLPLDREVVRAIRGRLRRRRAR